MVTRSDLDLGTVTTDVPHGNLLVRAGATLARWQAEVERLSDEMAKLQDEGVFLDEDKKPVVPVWWERKENGHHIAWYLVWPRKYASRAGRKRRQYVRADDYEATEAKVQQTLEYANLEARRDKIAVQIDQVGYELSRLAERFEW